MKTISSRQRRRLEAGIKAQIKRYQRCLELIPRVNPEVFSSGMDLFEAEAPLSLWLCEPAWALGGKTPLHVMRTAKGQKCVANILGAIEHGVFL